MSSLKALAAIARLAIAAKQKAQLTALSSLSPEKRAEVFKKAGRALPRISTLPRPSSRQHGKA